VVHWILFYDVVENYVERRRPFRDRHLEHARRAHERGDLVLAGALADPADGAVLVFRAPSAATAEQFARDDPYVAAGLVTAWRVREWTVVLGDGLDLPA
jgi:uncharacterized protein YciI